ncbi:copper resistance protein NlpE N-terminal domain-containing protein [Luteimonas huabeiensis]|uniref:copper resistance protein NlpE N-terminal domain-containing protein n=1 Tax=Luteimonas huabeiensis TaxID=1244513 RepID=UPI0004BBB8E2|nr:copper resistance protein NlpE N-terminal domain-containing protein [Luteimonas huabeiensis]
MAFPRVAVLPTSCLLLAACGWTAPQPVGEGERMAWQGLQACADCAGIETELVLERMDGTRSFRLTETYLTDLGATPFVDSGGWRVDASLIRLEGEGGSERAYAVLDDGRLQSRDAGGGALPGGGHVLQPIPADEP